MHQTVKFVLLTGPEGSSRARSCNVWQWRRTVVYVLLHDCVSVRVCNLHILHHTGHIGSYKLHTVHLRSMALLLSHSIFRLANTGWMLVFTFRLRSLSCSFTITAEIWSLNGKTTRTVSSVSLAGDNFQCGLCDAGYVGYHSRKRQELKKSENQNPKNTACMFKTDFILNIKNLN